MVIVVSVAGCSDAVLGSNAPSNNLSQSVSLSSKSLSYGTTTNIPLNIPKSDILNAVTALKGDNLTLKSVEQPPAGNQFSDQGDHYVFMSPTAGTVTLHYSVADANQLTTINLITIKVLPSGSATAAYYACGSSKLYQLSADNQSILKTVATTYLGKPIALNDLAIDANGNMYAKDQKNNGIYKLDAVSGIATQIVATIPNSRGYLEGLTFLPNGELATAQLDGTILSFNLSSLTTSVYLSTRYSMLGGDIKMLPDSFIYWTVSNATSTLCANRTGPGTQALVRIDPNTGTVVEMGCLSEPNILGLGFSHGTIYGFTKSGNVVKIDTLNAQTTIISSPGFEFWGAASNPALW
jgi:sugar lactone lactonase YvrE